MRKLAVALLLLGSFVVPTAAQARPKPATDVRAIVVRVDPHALVVRALDGSTQRIVVPPRAAISLDGKSVTLSALKPGDIVIVVRRGRGAAVEIRAFSP